MSVMSSLAAATVVSDPATQSVPWLVKPSKQQMQQIANALCGHATDDQ